MNFYQLTKKEEADTKPQKTKTAITTQQDSDNESSAAVVEITTKMTKKTDMNQDRKDSTGQAKRPSAGLSSLVASVRRSDNGNNNNVDGHQNFLAYQEARERRKQKQYKQNETKSSHNKKGRSRQQNEDEDEKKGKTAAAALGHIYIKDDEEEEGFETQASPNAASNKAAIAGAAIPGKTTTLPGAVRMFPGKEPAYPSSFVSRYTADGSEDLSHKHHDDEISLKSSPTKEEEDRSFRKSEEENASPVLANAFLVEDESYRTKHQTTTSTSSQVTATKPPAPLVEASPLVEEEKPWYTQKWFVIMLVSILIVTIIIAVTVPLATKGGPPSSMSNSPSASPVPSVAPSTRPSFAPTMTTTITAVVKLDSNPSDTSWRIDCENGQKNLINIPTRTYIAAYRNRTITQPFEVGVGDTCTFLITDASQDGLEEGSFYRVFLGTDYSVSDDRIRLIDGGGNFGSQTEISFEIMSLPPVPVPVPPESLSPTHEIQDGSEGPTTTSPSVAFPSPSPPLSRPPQFGFIQPLPVSDIVAPPAPTPPIPPPPPTPSPTAAPTVAPTVLIFVYITIVIQFDELPSETGWSLFCNGAERRTVTANTYSVPNGIVSDDTFMVQSGSDCEFTIRDTFGDGICCTFGDGYYQVLFHEEENGVEEGNFVVLENRTGVNPFDVQTLPFVASSTGINN